MKAQSASSARAVDRAVCRPPILASIGTVLIDSFETPSRTKAEIIAIPPSRELSSVPMTSANFDTGPNPSFRPTTSSSVSLSATNPLATISGQSTPQRNFDSPTAAPSDDVREVLGGGGMYALVGARIWLEAADLRCVVDRASEERGRDFPKDLEKQLNVFGENIWCWNEGTDTKATRSRLRYEQDGTRLFEFIQPPPQRTIASLTETPVFGSQYLHISPPYTPEDLGTVLEDLRTVQNSRGEVWHPTVIYEPHPRTCEPSHRAALEKIAPLINILSPNHEELLATYGQSCPQGAVSIKDLVEPLIRHLLHTVGVGRDSGGAVVVRCGRHGSCVGTKKGGIKWFPAYFSEENSDSVVDVSGAGNSYLGGYAAGLHLSGGDPYQAALYGTVSASFMCEQIGLPVFDVDGSGLWNGDKPQRRLAGLQKRISPLG